ncbi:MAG: N-acetylmuramoyl-L-alanine amidase [Ruminococcus sp.]|nr:N-acetylmuramoyl-L-alanine amidase [Ruminococcus sp.]
MIWKRFLASGIAGCLLCSAVLMPVYAVSPNAAILSEHFADPSDYGEQVYTEKPLVPIYGAVDEEAESNESTEADTEGEGSGETEPKPLPENEAMWNDTVRIMIDPGHAGYYNPSPVYGSYYESIMNWKLSNYLKTELEALGAEADITKTSLEDDPDLIPRGQMSDGYDFFISMHSNAASYSSIDAPLALCYQDVAWTDIDDISRDIGIKMAQLVADIMETSQDGEIYQKLSAEDRDENGVWDDEWYGVLCGARSVGTPGILLEHSYHTNYRATVWLSNDSNLQRMAKEEAAFIFEYFTNLKAEYRAAATTTEAVTTTTVPETSETTTTTTVTTVRIDPIAREDWTPGDVDGDGFVTLSDALFALVYYAELSAGVDAKFIQQTEDEIAEQLVFSAADIVADAQINLDDASEILNIYANHAAGIESEDAQSE